MYIRAYHLCECVRSCFVLPQIAELRAEYQQSNEEMLEAIRELSRELKLQTLLLDSYIPEEFQVCVGGGVRGGSGDDILTARVAMSIMLRYMYMYSINF